MFKSDVMGGVDYKRFVRYFYDPPPKYDESGTSIWFLGKEYVAVPPKPVTTTDHEDVVEIASSTDSHDPSDAATSATEDSHSSRPQRASFEDAQQISGENVPSVSNDPADGGWPLAFLDDFESRAWMTYRSNFKPIPRSQNSNAGSGISFSVRFRNLADRDGFSSDTGWGCMIRSGQSLLANALIVLHLGRDWRRPRRPHTSTAVTPQPPSTPLLDTPSQPTQAEAPSEASLLSLFADDPSALFSIHNFVSHGAASCNVHPGQWFGPSATASCISTLVSSNPSTNLRVYVTQNGSEVYEDRFRLIASTPSDPTINPTLILLGIRLGLDRITPVYHEALKSSLTYPQSIGIAGGRPSSSHYFVGHQDSLFLYLDPHETRPAFPYYSTSSQYTPEELDTVHTRRLRGLHISQMDPSMLIGFLIRDEADWEDWKRRIQSVKGKGIVHVYDKEPPHTGELRDGEGREREGAVDEVQVLDEDEDEMDDGVTVTGEEERRDEEASGVKEIEEPTVKEANAKEADPAVAMAADSKAEEANVKAGAKDADIKAENELVKGMKEMKP